FTPHPTQNHQHSITVEDFLSSPIPLSLPPKAVNPSEVKYLLKNLPYRKSPGQNKVVDVLKYGERLSVPVVRRRKKITHKSLFSVA
ncbi:hypothetical protein, partial [Klebsiella pneumoniae]|uniref:hypothetical protein n=1 Tax=Klebsiella pneumoniae TaxID=573 RepID=UPI00405572AE